MIRELQQFKIALDAHAIVAITDYKGKICYVNDKFCEISKYSAEELVGKDHRIINSGYHSKEFFRNLWDTIKSGKIWKGEIRNRAKDNSIYWVDTTIVPFLDDEGKPYQFIAIRAEVTLRKQLEDEILAKVAWQTAILSYAGHAMIATNPEGVIQTFNPTAEDMLGYKAEELVGKATPAVFHEPNEVIDRAAKLSTELGIAIEPGFEVFVARARKNHAYEDEWTYIHKDGTHFPVRLIVTAIKNFNEIIGFLGIAQNITEQKDILNKTKFLATHDELTGLANRYLLYDRIQQLLSDIERNHGSAAMLMIDLNDFKKINDTLGHDIGDLLLKEVSKRLTSTLRAIDTVARLGGDEFVVVTPHVSVAGIKLVVQKIIHLLPYPIFIANNEMKIGVSIGITLIPSEGKDTKTLLKNCDIAMYRAKKMGRNNYQFFSGELSNEVTVLNPKTLD